MSCCSSLYCWSRADAFCWSSVIILAPTTHLCLKQLLSELGDLSLEAFLCIDRIAYSLME